MRGVVETVRWARRRTLRGGKSFLRRGRIVEQIVPKIGRAAGLLNSRLRQPKRPAKPNKTSTARSPAPVACFQRAFSFLLYAKVFEPASFPHFFSAIIPRNRTNRCCHVDPVNRPIADAPSINHHRRCFFGVPAALAVNASRKPVGRHQLIKRGLCYRNRL